MQILDLQDSLYEGFLTPERNLENMRDGMRDDLSYFQMKLHYRLDIFNLSSSMNKLTRVCI